MKWNSKMQTNSLVLTKSRVNDNAIQNLVQEIWYQALGNDRNVLEIVTADRQ